MARPVNLILTSRGGMARSVKLMGSFPTKFEAFESLRRKAEIFGEGFLTLSDLKKSEITLW